MMESPGTICSVVGSASTVMLMLLVSASDSCNVEG